MSLPQANGYKRNNMIGACLIGHPGWGGRGRQGNGEPVRCGNGQATDRHYGCNDSLCASYATLVGQAHEAGCETFYRACGIAISRKALFAQGKPANIPRWRLRRGTSTQKAISLSLRCIHHGGLLTWT